MISPRADEPLPDESEIGKCARAMSCETAARPAAPAATVAAALVQRGFVPRAALLLANVLAVVCILYMTPYPGTVVDRVFKTCNRPCISSELPMICRVKLNLEITQTSNSGCNEICLHNKTQCVNCIISSGTAHNLLAINKQTPGPSIQVCKNDLLVVDVINRIPNRGVTIHWRGQDQTNTPYMDGVPMISQCPVTSYTTFQYKFRASNEGTYYYHAFAGSESADGIHGALIVRKPTVHELHRELYDTDSKEHVVVVSQLSRKPHPQVFLINGRSSQLNHPMSKFSVIQGLRHRFRLMYTGGAELCEMNFSIEDHELTVIALDGKDVKPFDVNNIVLARGESADFVVDANRRIRDYSMIISSDFKCSAKTVTTGIFSYMANQRAAKAINLKENEAKTNNKRRRVLNTADSSVSKCFQSEFICLSEVSSYEEMPEKMKTVHKKFYFPINLKSFYESGDLSSPIGDIGNLSFTFPSAPLSTLWHYGHKLADEFCSNSNRPSTCPRSSPGVCECVHVESVNIGDVVELILLEKSGEANHVFHLHGHDFRVVGSRQFQAPIDLDTAKDLDERGLLMKRNLRNPLRKNTVALPKSGVVAIRFSAENAGYWLLREEHSGAWSRGLDVVFEVGRPWEHRVPPSDFPKCGSYTGPDFFMA